MTNQKRDQQMKDGLQTKTEQSERNGLTIHQMIKWCINKLEVYFHIDRYKCRSTKQWYINITNVRLLY